MHHHPFRRLGPHRRYTPARRWRPLDDDEWDALLPFVPVQNRPSRPLRDARARMDAVFWVAAGCPWRGVTARFGKADTVSRHFRRLGSAGLWGRLLRASARPDCPPALLAIEHWIVRACRRATRIRGLRIIVLARRLGFSSALRGPSWYLPDPDLSEHVRGRALEVRTASPARATATSGCPSSTSAPSCSGPPPGAAVSPAAWSRCDARPGRRRRPPRPHRIGGANCSPPLVHSAFRPRSRPMGVACRSHSSP